ncbi:patatin-like phospholipase family protein [Pontiellaceae bacterium B12227]|nr:patatin-like phospholipase family protein [Pontiellaceae bacterium B12227]
MEDRRRTATWIVSTALMIIISGCATSRRPFPEQQKSLGTLNGYEPQIRIWGDRTLEPADDGAALMQRQVSSSVPEQFKKAQAFLAVSGGSQNGAFGAGLLNGWTQEGSRPEFRIVTGISTGSIIAPFAFMGPEYDEPLKLLFTQYSTKDVISKRLVKALFGGASLTDSTPLLELIAQYIDDDMIDAMAGEYAKGRRLYIGTTNLDAQRPVVWDVGKIAASDAPDKANLIHRIILASSSVPAAFPPVMFDVSKDGVEYDELHVDGGISYQLFINPSSVSVRKFMEKAGFTGAGTVYVIRNNHRSSAWEPVKKSGIAISSAALSGLTKNQGNSDQYIIYLQAQMDEMEFKAARITETFPNEPDEAFDPDYMNDMFEQAYEKARQGYPWSDIPL